MYVMQVVWIYTLVIQNLDILVEVSFTSLKIFVNENIISLINKNAESDSISLAFNFSFKRFNLLNKV